ncbi:MAG: dGTPase [Acidimicrobiales bacterium]|jgi:dGTPase
MARSDALVVAHRAIPFASNPTSPPERGAREDAEHHAMASGATRAHGAGTRTTPEEPDRFRTCFERDLDRIKHSKPFRRLAGKCQVFVAPDNDHLRNRLTHAIEVAQVAVSIARPLGLNLALTEAAALGHDCGHGPAGHASEDALSPFVPGGYHHAVYGADVVLEHLNLCHETADAIRNHSWNRPAPMTPEGEVVAWADRIAYVCHDFEDAVAARIVGEDDLPTSVTDIVGSNRRAQLHGFITSMVDASANAGAIGLDQTTADALAAFRAFNYDRIYLRPEAKDQATIVISLLQQLTEWLIHHPAHIGDGSAAATNADEVTALAVRYVSGMTDRFALNLAVEHLGWARDALPRSA